MLADGSGVNMLKQSQFQPHKYDGKTYRNVMDCSTFDVPAGRNTTAATAGKKSKKNRNHKQKSHKLRNRKGGKRSQNKKNNKKISNRR